MVVRYSRAQRRHDRKRLKIKRQFHWGYGHKDEWAGRTPEHAGEINFMSPRVAGGVVNTPTPCSCWMCGNPRHNGWSRKEAVTRQELKADDSFKDQVQDWDDWNYYGYEYYYDRDWYLNDLHYRRCEDE